MFNFLQCRRNDFRSLLIQVAYIYIYLYKCDSGHIVLHHEIYFYILGNGPISLNFRNSRM